MQQILDRNFDSGIYHYAGDSQCSWYQFAEEILSVAKSLGYLEKIPNMNEISTKEFSAKTNRPNYSVLDSSKFCKAFDVNPSNWKESLPYVIKYAELAYKNNYRV